MGHHEDIDKAVKTYVAVFLGLMVLTVVTVAVSYLNVTTAIGIGIALFIACIKGSLVACYFMHLIDEKRIIYWILLLTFAFFIPLIYLPIYTIMDGIVR